ncbi:MAG: ankyrin repeat domain-containing protein [Myxococcota bacterium]
MLLPPVLDALEKDDLKKLQRTRKNSNLGELLHRAAAVGAEACLEALLAEPGGEAAALAPSAVTLTIALHGAKTAPVARRLLALGSLPDARTVKQETPLHFAASLGRAEVIPVLLEAGATLEAQDQDGRTPLMAAVNHAHRKCVQALLAAGANPNHVDAGGVSVLAKAGLGSATAARRECVQLLLEAGADPSLGRASGDQLKLVRELAAAVGTARKKKPSKR